MAIIEQREQVNHPRHYGGGDNPYEVIKVLEAWGFNNNARLWNTIKYIARARLKGTYLDDLKKARWYLDREIERTEVAGEDNRAVSRVAEAQ